jgi:hypothetical protein
MIPVGLKVKAIALFQLVAVLSQLQLKIAA